MHIPDKCYAQTQAASQNTKKNLDNTERDY